MRVTTILLATLASLAIAGTAAADERRTTVRIKTDQAGAEVTLDGRAVGTTPLTLEPLADGRYTLLFDKPGYERQTETLDLKNGRPASLFVVLRATPVPLPALSARFTGRHLHDEGHCDGTVLVERDRLEFSSGSAGGHRIVVRIPSIKIVMRRHAATYRHRMATLPIAGTVAIKGGSAEPVAPVHVDADGDASDLLVLDSETKGIDETGTRALYDLVYRLWDAVPRR